MVQKGGRGWEKVKHVTNKAEGLERSPSVWVKLGGSHIECPMDTHGEIIKRESDMQVRKKTRINKEERTL